LKRDIKAKLMSSAWHELITHFLVVPLQSKNDLTCIIFITFTVLFFFLNHYCTLSSICIYAFAE